MNWRNPSDDTLLPLQQARQGFDPAPRHLDPLNLEGRTQQVQPPERRGNEYGPLPQAPLQPNFPASSPTGPSASRQGHDETWGAQPTTPINNGPGNRTDGPSDQQQLERMFDDDARRSGTFSKTYELGLERERRQEKDMSFCELRTKELVGRIASRYEEPEEMEKRNMDKTYWEVLMEEQDREFNEMFP